MTVVEIAEAAGISRQAVYWKRRRGESDEQIIAGATPVDPSDNETLVDAQLRKESALADLRQLEVQEKQGELIPLAEAMASWAALIQLTRAKMSAIPNALCDQLAAYTDAGEVRLFLMREIEERLVQLAEEFSATARGIMGDGGEGDEASGTSDGDGVGEKV